jgi:hypothetical protein
MYPVFVGMLMLLLVVLGALMGFVNNDSEVDTANRTDNTASLFIIVGMIFYPVRLVEWIVLYFVDYCFA